jgi:hypothetical protein
MVQAEAMVRLSKLVCPHQRMIRIHVCRIVFELMNPTR